MTSSLRQIPAMRFTFVVLFGCAIATQSVAQQSVHAVRYGRDVRPILADRCFQCHGPDESAREAELRLDKHISVIANRGGYAVIVPSHPAQSELLRRVRDDEEPMPPDEHARLTPEEVAVLEKWIAAGAVYDDHWSYVAPTRVAMPRVAGRDWGSNYLDRFVLSGLERGGFAPAPVADPRTLIRRLSFDLLGLPPSWEQVEAFVSDSSESAWEQLVEGMLSSERHAERLATFWFDLVRFADTIGIHADNPWHISPYRDWVLQAFLTNMPFDQFTIEQIAGDLLPDASLSQQVGAAYNRLNLITREGGSQPKEFLIRYTADRVRNLSEVWLATSMGCCECHDHKFDPLTTREFYELGAFFADIEQVGVYGAADSFAPELAVPSIEQEAALQHIEQELAQVTSALAANSPEMDVDRRSFDNALRGQDWQTAVPLTATSVAGAQLTVLADGSVLAEGPAAEKDTYELSFKLSHPAVHAVRLELLSNPSLPHKGPGRAGNGNLVLSEIEVLVGGEGVPIHASRATFEQGGYPVAAAHDGKRGRKGWAVLNGAKSSVAEAVFDFHEALPVAAEDGALMVVVRLHQEHGSKHLLGRWRLSWADRSGHLPVVAADRELLANDGMPRSVESEARLSALHRANTPLLAAARESRAALTSQRNSLRNAIPKVLQTRSVKPMETRIRPRGNWMDDSGEVVSPGVPRAFGFPMRVTGRATRLDLARWIVDASNPLTARVLVNRLWRMLMGRGVVGTLDDFGAQGADPVDAGLLDYLAQELVTSGWDIRHVLRTIVLSSAYRQASWGAGVSDVQDMGDVFGRQMRYRIDAEFVRDNALAVSGLLVNTLGGDSVRPYQPAGYWAHLNFPRRTYKPSSGGALYRRSVYGHWQRQFVHPSMLAFDAPSRERCTAERPRSNTPQAALASLNDPIFVESARVLAGRALRAPLADDTARLRFMWRRALQRDPSTEEQRDVFVVLHAHRDHYRAHPEAAKALLDVGESPLDPKLDVVEQAAWTSCARVVLNLHEAIVRS